MKKKELIGQINFYQLIPFQNIKWQKDDKGLITLLKPKFRHPFLVKHLLPRLKNPYFKIRLDAVGSFIWTQCNGRCTVKELAENLEAKFGNEVKPVEERLTLFLQSLEKNRFIIYKHK
ncbi:MAG: PqqD family protein [Candidatus Aminicenantales bacterium]